MTRECLMDDNSYRGFEECANYESCTNDFVAELLEPYDVESIAELVKNSYNKGQEAAVKYLIKNGYIKYGFETKYLLEQIKKGVENG